MGAASPKVAHQSATAPHPRRHKARLKPVRLCVDVLRVKHGYRSLTDLWKAVAQMGIEISRPQLSRVVNNTGDKLDKELLAALASLFKCSVKDLFED